MACFEDAPLFCLDAQAAFGSPRPNTENRASIIMSDAQRLTQKHFALLKFEAGNFSKSPVCG